MSWVVCGDFNEILHLDEKTGWNERDADQIKEFIKVLSRCGLFYLGFVGQRFTWCNGWFGEQRNLLRLDKMVANEAWVQIFPEAKVHHILMSASDHCLLAMFFNRNQPHKRSKRRFFFEAMWVKEEECK